MSFFAHAKKQSTWDVGALFSWSQGSWVPLCPGSPAQELPQQQVLMPRPRERHLLRQSFACHVDGDSTGWANRHVALG